MVKKIRADGSTALSAGLLDGLSMMRQRQEKNDVSSIMLFTDGDANIGYVTAQDIIKATLGSKYANTPRITLNNDNNDNNDDFLLPCTINTFGFGTDHKASLLQAIAEHGRGMYAYIDKLDMISNTFAECLGGLISVVAQKKFISLLSV